MHSLDTIFLQMKSILNQLIDNAEKLKRSSNRMISQEEINALQMKQEQLMKQLEEINETLEKKGAEHIQDLQTGWKQIHEQLEKFQSLNMNFIENLKAKQQIIQFDKKRKK